MVQALVRTFQAAAGAFWTVFGLLAAPAIVFGLFYLLAR